MHRADRVERELLRHYNGYTDPGFVADSSAPDDAGLVSALLGAQSRFNWINHTWSHLFLGCTEGDQQALSSVTGSDSGGSLAAGTYSYEITAATATASPSPRCRSRSPWGPAGGSR